MMHGEYRSYALPVMEDTPCQTILMCNAQSAKELKAFLQKTLNDIEVYGKPIQGTISQYHSTTFVCTPKWNGKEY